jgi:hypothetical protein
MRTAQVAAILGMRNELAGQIIDAVLFRAKERRTMEMAGGLRSQRISDDYN